MGALGYEMDAHCPMKMPRRREVLNMYTLRGGQLFQKKGVNEVGEAGIYNLRIGLEQTGAVTFNLYFILILVTVSTIYD